MSVDQYLSGDNKFVKQSLLSSKHLSADSQPFVPKIWVAQKNTINTFHNEYDSAAKRKQEKIQYATKKLHLQYYANPWPDDHPPPPMPPVEWLKKSNKQV